jgi:hypothetical protein
MMSSGGFVYVGEWMEEKRESLRVHEVKCKEE